MSAVISKSMKKIYLLDKSDWGLKHARVKNRKHSSIFSQNSDILNSEVEKRPKL